MGRAETVAALPDTVPILSLAAGLSCSFRGGLRDALTFLVDPLSKLLDAPRRGAGTRGSVQRPRIVGVLIEKPASRIPRFAVAPLLNVVRLMPQIPKSSFDSIELRPNFRCEPSSHGVSLPCRSPGRSRIDDAGEVLRVNRDGFPIGGHDSFVRLP